MIKVTEGKITGSKHIFFDCFEDHRGTFSETFNSRDFESKRLPKEWKQDNVSISRKNVLRGLHIQSIDPQGKLVRCLRGKIYDVWLDLRPTSPTFMRWQGVFLSGKENRAVYIPPGCAHGFYSMFDDSVVYYKCTSLYDKESDGGVIWNDARVGINWPLFDEPIISEKDQSLPSLEKFLRTWR